MSKFVKGISGNPGGKAKAKIVVERDGVLVEVTIAELAKEKTVVALSTLEEICENKKAPAVARVAASTALLDRGWGKPRQEVEVGGIDGAPIEIEQRVHADADAFTRGIAGLVARLAEASGASEAQS